jgi:LmbE family N-acetylglucosaminyl deacetylase
VNWTAGPIGRRIQLTVRIICIGAHPDDCEIEFGGAAYKFAAAGHAVKFLSVTNGAAGHHVHPAEELVAIRKNEAKEAARRLGLAETEILGYKDGELLPTLDAREEIVRRIRRWNADIVLTHRPWDYHPDHRYTGQLVQDSAYLVMVPRLCPDTPALRHNPLFLYLEDGFQLPAPFVADVAVGIDDVWDRKIGALDAHASQFYEWLPWINKQVTEGREVPRDHRLQWLSKTWGRPISECARVALTRRYGSAQIQHAEAFQICEYGRRASRQELDEIFPR